MGRHQPALLGGLFIGVLSSLPVVNIANCCCLWVIGGGMLVVYLQQQNTADPVETADAVLGGLIAGAIGAAIVILAQWAITSAAGSLWQEQVRSAIEGNPDVPPELRELILNITSSTGSMALLAAVITVPLYAVFGMLGSLLGLAVFRKKTPPQATPQG
jgi:hypothetical protein